MTFSSRFHASNENGPVPTGWAVEYSVLRGFSAASSWNSSSAVGLCMENAGSDRAEMNPANGFFSAMVTLASPSAVQDS